MCQCSTLSLSALATINKESGKDGEEEGRCQDIAAHPHRYCTCTLLHTLLNTLLHTLLDTLLDTLLNTLLHTLLHTLHSSCTYP